MALTAQAHQRLRSHFLTQEGNLGTAIDATCGNGHDMEFLCSLGFCKVVGFDIQQRAIKTTRHRLEMAGYKNFSLQAQSHADLDQFINEKIDCAMFNFGYLPNGDKTITTLAQSSLSAIEKSVDMLNPSGILSAICYPGHDQGWSETKKVVDYLEALPNNFELSKVESAKANDRTPILLILTKANQ